MSLVMVRLGDWGSEGLTLGRHVSACVTILRLRVLLIELIEHGCLGSRLLLLPVVIYLSSAKQDGANRNGKILKLIIKYNKMSF